MTYIDELLKLPNYWKKIIKKLESTKLKLLKAKWSTYFNNVCLTENLLPNYTRRPIYLCYSYLNIRRTPSLTCKRRYWL